MTARLVRLRIAGFKSFAEPVSLDILPGLTGIVGPNGCGKSNVADALRWAMGETSARSLRGGEMDDVIFSGTTARASRNLAEVSVSMEAGDGPLPAPFDQEAELQVTRRIERGAGSVFRANGRELRARDVQTLYADLASGARSSGMVSQGRVAALVGARPEERRQVLEEAAGIAGLHTRRHEAELKLRAAEQNLGRSEDSRAQIESARDNLRRQARQAARYRGISDLIRAAEAEHLAVLHGRASAAQEAARRALDTAEAALEAAEQEHDTAAAALADAEAGLPQPRQREAEARSVLERRRVEADSLAEQAERARTDHAAAADRLQHLTQDLAAATRALADAQDSVSRLICEHARLNEQRAALPAQIRAATRTAEDARCALEADQAKAELAIGEAASAARQLAQADDTLRQTAARVQELRSRHGTAAAELDSANRQRVPQRDIDAAGEAQALAQAGFDDACARLEAAETARSEASSRAAEAAGQALHQHAQRQRAAEAAETCAARLAEAEAAWSEATARLARLEGERVAACRLSAADRMADTAEAELARAEAAIEAAEHAAASARAEAAQAHRVAEADRAAVQAAGSAHDAAAARRVQLSSQVAQAEDALASAMARPPPAAEVEGADLALQAAEAARACADELIRQTGVAAAEAAQAASRSRAEWAELAAHAARLSAEAGGLSAAFGPEQQDGALSGLSAPPGLEAAVGAALGEAAQSSLDPERSTFWRALDAVQAPEPPAGTVALAGLVRAPDALGRALSHAVLLDEAAEGDAVQAQLTPGMVAVGRDGACWRWDGLVIRAGAPNPAAARLLARRRLDAISVACRAAQAREAAAEAAASVHARTAADAEVVSAQARARAEMAGHRHTEALAFTEALRTAARQRDEDVAALSYAAQRLRSDLEDAQRLESASEMACAALQQPDPGALTELDATAAACETALDAARSQRLTCRTRAMDLRRAAQALAGQAARALALIEAAAATAERAQFDREAARRACHEAEAALAALPDMSVLDARCARLAEAEGVCRQREAATRAARAVAETALDAARRTAAKLQLSHSQAETRWSWLTDLCTRTAEELRAGEQACVDAERASEELPDTAALHVAAQNARERLESSRRSAAQAQALASALEATLAQAERAAPSVAAELGAWQARLDEALLRQTNLTDRHAAAQAECAALAAEPGHLAAQAERVRQALAAASATHRASEAALEAAHGRVRALAGAERDAARAAGGRREGLAHAQASVAAAASQAGTVSARIVERLGSGAHLPDAPDLSDVALEKTLRRMERLARERDEMGPVNLRAELEVAELDERLATLARDRDELTTAIAKLRGAIGHLNREGRERLQTVFSQVDQHFRALFTRMMGGGQAHLAWTGSDDPLEAGLDIFAEPPGKKLTSLSLLSGGEQALTALSLIFAVFRCTPAPLCVLDEVDAPLDDANVDRFCTLLDEMARETGTSFLVVTHHQLTMSRMDRLYGVTMQERGVSRLLSVDLSRAVALAEPVRVAAE